MAGATLFPFKRIRVLAVIVLSLTAVVLAYVAYHYWIGSNLFGSRWRFSSPKHFESFDISAQSRVVLGQPVKLPSKGQRYVEATIASDGSASFVSSAIEYDQSGNIEYWITEGSAGGGVFSIRNVVVRAGSNRCIGVYPATRYISIYQCSVETLLTTPNARPEHLKWTVRVSPDGRLMIKRDGTMVADSELPDGDPQLVAIRSALGDAGWGRFAGHPFFDWVPYN